MGAGISLAALCMQPKTLQPLARLDFVPVTQLTVITCAFLSLYLDAVPISVAIAAIISTSFGSYHRRIHCWHFVASILLTNIL